MLKRKVTYLLVNFMYGDLDKMSFAKGEGHPEQKGVSKVDYENK